MIINDVQMNIFKLRHAFELIIGGDLNNDVLDEFACTSALSGDYDMDIVDSTSIGGYAENLVRSLSRRLHGKFDNHRVELSQIAHSFREHVGSIIENDTIYKMRERRLSKSEYSLDYMSTDDTGSIKYWFTNLSNQFLRIVEITYELEAILSDERKLNLYQPEVTE